MRRRFDTAFSHVDMRIGAIHHQHVGVVDHFLRDIGVQVKGGDDRNIRANDIAYGCKQRALRVRFHRGDSPAMQRQKHAVHR